MTTAQRFSSSGAYGFRFSGLAHARHLLVDAPESWPDVAVVRETSGTRPAREYVNDEHARLWLAGGAWAELRREPGQAEVRVPEGTSDQALVHPYLAPVALVMARWHGREGFHAGGLVADGGVWGVMGDKTAGKSTLLAWLARAGAGILSDDVLVIDGDRAFAGPRSIDLRSEAAEVLGAGEALGHIGARDRWRVPLDPVPAELPLRGWISLEWGDAVALESVRGSERLMALMPHRGVRLEPAIPAALVRLSALPHLRLTRPRDWGSMGEVADRLLAALAG
jgi:hypothetical protein